VTDLADYLVDEQARRHPMAEVGKFADLLARSGVAVEDIGRINKVNAWQGMYAEVVNCDACHGSGGTPDDVCPECHGDPKRRVPRVVDMVGVSLTPAWSEGPAWPVVQPAAPAKIKHMAPKARPRLSRQTVILPDPQIGFRRYEDGTLDPMHDERAMVVALSIIEMVRPQVIVNLGDFLDLAEWSSKFAVLPEFSFTTQAAVYAGYRFLADQRAAADDLLEAFYLLEGNHDDRLPRLIMQNAKTAMRLRRADQPEGWPVMTVPNLLCLDTLGVEYIGGYPAGRIKLAEKHGTQTALYALHGEKLDMVKQAKAERQSTVQGHAHHVSMHSETYEDDGDAYEVEAWSLGCLCRTDGAVPSTHGGTDAKGKPVVRHESWQQSVAVLSEDEDGWDLEPVRIRNGRAVFRGKVIQA